MRVRVRVVGVKSKFETQPVISASSSYRHISRKKFVCFVFKTLHPLLAERFVKEYEEVKIKPFIECV